jgi:hypothetical protein
LELQQRRTNVTRRTVRPRVRLAAYLAVATLTGVLVGGSISSGVSATGHKVTICHRTKSYSNPYNQITVDIASILQKGHGSHDGVVFNPSLAKGEWGDIIPAFDFGPGLQYWGKNVTPEGAAIFDAGCELPSPPTTEPPTTEPPTTEPPTTEPPTTEPPTTEPPQS